MADDPDPEHMARFCREILPGMLVEACEAAAPDAGLVADDVLLRAEAAARLDPAMREILAAPFFEESFSHEPDDASAWMKAITVLVSGTASLRNCTPMARSTLEASPPWPPTGWGRYHTSSQPGGGTLFRLSLPMTRSTAWLTRTHVPGLVLMRCGLLWSVAVAG